jgi:hypothetical protein
VEHVDGKETSAWVGVVNENTVLKRPLEQSGDTSRLEIERAFLTQLALTNASSRFICAADTSLYFENAANEALVDHSLRARRALPSTIQRASWCLGAAKLSKCS